MVKTLLKQVKEFKKDSLMTPCFMILEVLMEVLIPLLMGSIINDGIEKGNIQHIYLMGAAMLVAAVIGLFAGAMGGKYGARAATGFAKNLREAMFTKIQTFSFANIDKFSTAGLVTRLTTDVSNLQNAYQMILRMCIRAPFSLVIAMVASYFVSPRIARIYLTAVFLLGAVLVTIMKFAMIYFSQLFEKYDALNESTQENVTASRVVKAYVREDYEIKKFQKASGDVYDLGVRAEKMIILNSPFMQATVYTCILLISWIGAHMIVSDQLLVGDLSTLLAYCMNILMNLMMLSMVFVMITMSMASAKRVAEVLNEESTIKNPKDPVMNVGDGSIEFRDVTFRYDEHSETPVLDHVNLKIASGETIGIIGGTGSSKTSLVNLISRLYDASSGKVMVGGWDVREYDLEALRNQVSMVLQKNELFYGTILDNLRWGDETASEEECRRACRMACADEFIEKMPQGYETIIEQGGSNVSGGQKQRLCIARALLKKPKILILDDSTSAVDTATDAKIRKALAEELPEMTKLIIAQRISSVQLADRIIVMNDGKVDGVGTHEELLENNVIYREVYEAQTGGNRDFDENGGEH
ncbi:MAG: ABC transporter ATP-binding protein [Lachnospiraceae bacterium]|nr:ABC transporter ATP-binding protein [Lachnospiraceae bacterium]